MFCDLCFRSGTTGLDPGAVAEREDHAPQHLDYRSAGRRRGKDSGRKTGQTRCVVYALTKSPARAVTETRDPQTSCARGKPCHLWSKAAPSLPVYAGGARKYNRQQLGRAGARNPSRASPRPTLRRTDCDCQVRGPAHSAGIPRCARNRCTAVGARDQTYQTA